MDFPQSPFLISFPNFHKVTVKSSLYCCRDALCFQCILEFGLSSSFLWWCCLRDVRQRGRICWRRRKVVSFSIFWTEPRPLFCPWSKWREHYVPQIIQLSREDSHDSGLRPVRLEAVQVLTCLAVNMTCRLGLTSIFTLQTDKKKIDIETIIVKNRIIDH